jgi:hypothetical protein
MSEEGLRREGMQWLSEDGIETLGTNISVFDNIDIMKTYADTWTFCVEAEQHWF